MSLEKQIYNNILIIKPSSLGDVVRAVPIFHGLREKFPQARISWLIRPDCAGMIEYLPGLDEKILFDRKLFGKFGREFKATKAFFHFLKEIRQKEFDLVVDLQGLFRSGLVTKATRAKTRLGFTNAREGATLFYTHKIEVAKNEHIVDSLWRFSKALGFNDLKKNFRLSDGVIHDAALADIYNQHGLSSKDNYVIQLIGGTEASKQWPIENYAKLAQMLKNDYDFKTVVLGAGPVETELANQLEELTSGEIVNLVNKTNLQQIIPIMSSAKLIVGNDSGPLHIGATLSTPLIGIYGPTNPAIVGPYGHLEKVVQAGASIPRKHRYSKDQRHNIDTISVDQVEKTIKKLLN